MVVIFVGYFFSYTLNAGVNAIGLDVFGLDSAQVSNLLVWSILLAAVLGFVCGPVVKKIGRSAAIIMALLTMGLGLIAVALQFRTEASQHLQLHLVYITTGTILLLFTDR